MSEKVRIGIVGIGNMGSNHSKNILAHKVEHLELAAVCDIAPEKLAWAEKNLPGVSRFSDYKEMIASGLLDAVLIATPPLSPSGNRQGRFCRRAPCADGKT